MESLNENATVGSLVANKPEYASLFEKLGIDYCCKGNKTLKEVCEDKKLSIFEVMQKLKQMPATKKAINWNEMSSQEIIEHIVATHHIYTRHELARLSQLIKKLNIKHGERYPYIAELRNIFEELKDSLLSHMDEEEQVVFPLIASLGRGEAAQGEAKVDLTSLDKDHLETGDAFEKIKKLTDGYTPPEGACMTHIVVLDSLERLEQNLHEHIHKEAQILFPRVKIR